MIKFAILTISDGCSKGEREDKSGPAIQNMLENDKFTVTARMIVADEKNAICEKLKELCDRADIDIILTTGGTGLGPRDVAPEATEAVCQKLVPGLAEIIRTKGWEKTKRAVLSRAIAGIRHNILIINLPGSQKGATESLHIIKELLPHAVHMMQGGGH